MKYFSPSIYYDPAIPQFSNPFLRVISVISTICYIFLMFLIINKSEKLLKFKWLLIFYMTSSYLFNMVEVFFEVTPLFPATALIFEPVLGGLETPWMATLGLFAYAFSIHLVIISLVAQIIYKFIKIHPNFEQKFSKFRYVIKAYIIIMEIFISGVVGYLVYLSVNPSLLSLQKEIIQNTAPFLSEFVGNSLLIVFSTNLSNCFLMLAYSLILYILFAILAIVYLRMKINERRKVMSSKTLKMLVSRTQFEKLPYSFYVFRNSSLDVT